MGTAGHVDHGKTALIKALTHVDCDTHREEKRRGITINLGFTFLDQPSGFSIGIIDVPGHKDFIHTMVAGVSGIDLVLLVIAADSGIMPQTREHVNILQILGIKKGIIALTKTDLVDEDLISLATDEIRQFVQGTFLEQSPVIHVSSVTGTGIPSLKKVIEHISAGIETREKGQFFRMYMDRIFHVKGHGHVVTGTVTSGDLDISNPVCLLPGNPAKFRIRRIEKYGKPTEKISAGDRAAINIAGLERADFELGKILTDTILEETTLLDARLSLFPDCPPLALWSKVLFFSGTFYTTARIHLLDRDRLRGGESGMVQIHLEKPGIVLHGDKFIIRNTSSDMTLGGGMVMDARPLHHRRRTVALKQSMARLAEGDLGERIRMEVNKHLRPVTAEEIAKNLNRSADEILGVCRSAAFRDVKIYPARSSLVLINADRDKRFIERITGSILAFHKRNPLIPGGLSENELISKLGFTESPTGRQYCRILLEDLKRLNVIRRSGTTWNSAGHQVLIPEQVKRDTLWLERIINEYNTQVPLLSEMRIRAKKYGISENELHQYLYFLIRTGKIYHIEDEYIGSEIVDKCRTMLLKELHRIKSGISVAGFRDLISGNRKLALTLLAQYDSESIIRREGDLRYLTEKGETMIQ